MRRVDQPRCLGRDHPQRGIVHRGFIGGNAIRHYVAVEIALCRIDGGREDARGGDHPDAIHDVAPLGSQDCLQDRCARNQSVDVSSPRHLNPALATEQSALRPNSSRG